MQRAASLNDVSASVAQFRAETARHSGVPELLEFTNQLDRQQGKILSPRRKDAKRRRIESPEFWHSEFFLASSRLGERYSGWYLSDCGGPDRHWDMNAVIAIAGLWLKRSLAVASSIGPYALIEILLPGGTLIALLLWLSRRGAFVQRTHPCNSTTPPCITRSSGISSSDTPASRKTIGLAHGSGLVCAP